MNKPPTHQDGMPLPCSHSVISRLGHYSKIRWYFNIRDTVREPAYAPMMDGNARAGRKTQLSVSSLHQGRAQKRKCGKGIIFKPKGIIFKLMRRMWVF